MGVILLSSLGFWYQSHREHLDILGIKRTRFVALSSPQMKKIGSFEFEQVKQYMQQNVFAKYESVL